MSDVVPARDRTEARYRWLRDLKCNQLYLTRDGDHACNYMTAREWIAEHPEDFADDDPAEVELMAATNTIWRLQIYPRTPVGFNVWHASTMDAVIDAAMRDSATSDAPPSDLQSREGSARAARGAAQSTEGER